MVRTKTLLNFRIAVCTVLLTWVFCWLVATVDLDNLTGGYVKRYKCPHCNEVVTNSERLDGICPHCGEYVEYLRDWSTEVGRYKIRMGKYFPYRQWEPKK